VSLPVAALFPDWPRQPPRLRDAVVDLTADQLALRAGPGKVVERQHVRLAAVGIGHVRGVLIDPEWMDPSARTASQRSRMVVAPWSTWYSHDGTSRRSSIR
jgi:hypothetical protein